jgi:hypothetical protein
MGETCSGAARFERYITEHGLNILRSGECIEDYPDDYPFPSGLFFGWHRAKPLHVVAALEETSPRVYIITAYEPDLEHFENDFRTRRKK